MVPTLNGIAERLIHGLLRKFSPVGEVKYKRGDISALWENPLEMAQRLEIYGCGGWFNLGHILQELDAEPLPKSQGDIRQVPHGLLWTPVSDLVGGGHASEGEMAASPTPPSGEDEEEDRNQEDGDAGG